MNAEAAHRRLQTAIRERKEIKGDDSLDIAIRPQDSAALTLIALELRALRQSFELGETPVRAAIRDEKRA